MGAAFLLPHFASFCIYGMLRCVMPLLFRRLLLFFLVRFAAITVSSLKLMVMTAMRKRRRRKS